MIDPAHVRSWTMAAIVSTEQLNHINLWNSHGLNMDICMRYTTYRYSLNECSLRGESAATSMSDILPLETGNVHNYMLMLLDFNQYRHNTIIETKSWRTALMNCA